MDGMTLTMGKQRPAKKPLSTLGERVRSAREEREMSQIEVANLLGLSRAAVAQWESNTTSPSLFKTVEAAKILGVSPEWLAFGIADPVVQKDDERITKLPEMVFEGTSTPKMIPGAWSFPTDWLRGDLRCQTIASLSVWRVEGGNMAPKYEEGDRIVIDTSIKRPTPSGVFLVWNGFGPVLHSITVRPVEGRPRAIVTSLDGSDSFEADPEDLTIIGRVRGVLKAS